MSRPEPRGMIRAAWAMISALWRSLAVSRADRRLLLSYRGQWRG
jgi:hypothetical protein